MSRKNVLYPVSNKSLEQNDPSKVTNIQRRSLPAPVHDESACYLETQNPDAMKYLQPVTVPDYVVPEGEHAVNIDQDDMHNPYTVSVYADEVYRYLHSLQVWIFYEFFMFYATCL